MLTLDQVRIGYGSRCVSGPLNAALRPGEFVCLLGANGAGKSTLLRTLAGMQPTLGGHLRLGGRELKSLPPRERAQGIAVVLTDRPGTGLLTAYELVALGRVPHTGWQGRLQDSDHAAVREALQAVGSLDFAERLVSDLSDGERQRIWLARALAQAPTVLLLDEVLAFLDLPRRIQIMHLLKKLARSRNIAVLLSCHDLELALRDADLLWLMDQDGGFHCGTPDAMRDDGTLGRAFAREGLRFDAATSRFTVAEEA